MLLQKGSVHDSCIRVAKITVGGGGGGGIAPGYKYQTAAEPSKHLYEYYKDTDLSPVYFLYSIVFKLLIGLNETSCKPFFSICILLEYLDLIKITKIVF